MDNDIIAEKLIKEPNHIRLPLLAELYTSDREPAPLVQALCSCLSDSDESLRNMAMLVLERCGPEAVAPLAELLAPAYPIQTRAAAAASLGRMGPAAAPASAALCLCLQEDDETLRSHAVFALGCIGAAAVPDLQGLLSADELKVNSAVLETLGYMGPAAQAAADDIRKLIAAQDPLLQVDCAGCLARIDVADPQGLPQLIAALQRNESAVRAAAVRWIGKLAGNGETALPELLNCLQDETAEVRSEAALALARVKPTAVEAVDPLIGLLGDSAHDVLVNAGIALGTIGPPAADALKPLKTLQGHADERVAQVAGAAIAHIDPKA
jgi:HEAT repeat protein